MTGEVTSAGAVAFLLDIIPVIAGILLFISFIRGRQKRRTEEAELKEAIVSFSDAAITGEDKEE